MAKPTRTATGRGMDRKTMASAKIKTANKLVDSGMEGKGPSSWLSKADKLAREGRNLNSQSSRIKKAGERMARAQAMAKAKQKGK